MGQPPRRRTLPLNDWKANLDRSSFSVGTGCTFAVERLDGSVLAMCAACSRSKASYAVVGQVKNHSPTRLSCAISARALNSE
jgi:hypothetical protein